MMIWRNLDPKLLGELLLDVAQAFAAMRKPRPGTDAARAPFRPEPPADKPLDEPRLHTRR